MPSLVSNFIINPVLRQARRFSSGFATEEPPALPLPHHRTRSVGEAEANFAVDNAILELDGDGEGEGDPRTPNQSVGDETRRTTHPRYPPIPGPRTTSRRNTLDRFIPAGAASGPADAVPGDASSVQPRTPNSPDNGIAQLVWVEEASRSTPLPEDDGNGELRKRILAIQAMDVSQIAKAQLMHHLLIEGYMKSKSRQQPPTSPPFPPTSPSARSVSDRKEPEPEPTGALQQALKFLNPLGDGTGHLDLPLSESDLRKTYVPSVPASDDFLEQLGMMGIEDHGQPVLGCEHYRRNVKLQCATCDKWYTCRFCHDAVEDHILPRKETKNMLCMLCGCPQRASDTCIRCGESAAYYFCGVCKLWNDDPNKSIYHCNDCGLCRVGQGLGKDFFHCKKCMACISMAGVHKCIERSIDCDCPICGDYMFNSPKPVIFMQCGHSIHRRCFDEHTRTSYKCPICNKSCVNMESKFRSFDMAILTQPMPPEYRDARAIVSCNDCSAKSQTAYHWLGLKCSLCSSYNTIQLQLLHMPGQEDTQPSSGPATDWTQLGVRPVTSGNGARRLSGLAAEVLPDIAALARQLRRSGRARAHAERATSPSVLSRLFAPRQLARSVSPDPATASSFASAVPAVPTTSAVAEALDSEEEEIYGILASSPDPLATAALAVANGGLGRGLMRGGETDDSEEEDEDMLDFWGRNGEGLVSASGVGGDEEDESGSSSGSSSSSSSDDDGCDDDDEEEQIVLFGHR